MSCRWPSCRSNHRGGRAARQPAGNLQVEPTEGGRLFHFGLNSAESACYLIVAPLPRCQPTRFPAYTPVLYCGAFSRRQDPLSCGEMECGDVKHEWPGIGDGWGRL